MASSSWSASSPASPPQTATRTEFGLIAPRRSREATAEVRNTTSHLPRSEDTCGELRIARREKKKQVGSLASLFTCGETVRS